MDRLSRQEGKPIFSGADQYGAITFCEAGGIAARQLGRLEPEYPFSFPQASIFQVWGYLGSKLNLS